MTDSSARAPSRATDARPGAAAEHAPRGDASDGDGTPDGPEQHHWLWLGVKMALAMYLADLAARAAGFADPTLSVISAAFLATDGPLGSFRTAGRRVLALGVGLAVGTAGALAGDLLSGVPSLHFALLGLVVGALGSRSSDYLFAAVVGTVVTFVGAGGSDPLVEVVVATGCMVAIGCVVGPAVVWATERLRELVGADGG